VVSVDGTPVLTLRRHDRYKLGFADMGGAAVEDKKWSDFGGPISCKALLIVMHAVVSVHTARASPRWVIGRFRTRFPVAAKIRVGE